VATQSSAPQERHAICPRCGADPAGAVWCPRCGLNLRIRLPPPPPVDSTAGTPLDSAPHEPFTGGPRNSDTTEIIEPRPSRTPLFVGGALAAAVVLGIVLAIVLSGGHNETTGGSHGTLSAPGSTPSTSSPSPTTTEAPPAVTATVMHDVLNAYATAYSAEDLSALRSLFSADLVRQNGSDRPQGLTGALNTYAGQFDQLSNPQYELSDIQYQEGATAGGASGTYRITDDNGVNTGGQIEFGFTVRQGGLLIDRIQISPES